MINYAIPDDKFTLGMEIAKPDRTIIGNVNNAYDRQLTLKLGRLNELSFSLPYWVSKRNEHVRNPEIDKIKTMYQLKVTLNGQVEWYVLSNKTKSTSDGKEIMSVTFTSLGYQLRGKKIRQWAGVWMDGEFRKESLNAKQVLDSVLSTSVWSVSYIDAEFLTKYRSFDFSGTSALDAVYQIAEVFEAIILWDTENKSIQLVKQENVGTNKGFEISYGNYLKSLTQEELSDEVVTRLNIYGQDELSIHRVNPLGTSYVEDFGYFMKGFKMDSVGNVIASSINGMSDGLAKALVQHQEVIKANKDRFKVLIEQLDILEKSVSVKELEIADLAEKIKVQQNIIDVKDSEGVDSTVEKTEEARLKRLLVTVDAELAGLNAQILAILTEVESIKNTIDIEASLTIEQLQELDNFVLEEDWEDGNYTDDMELYEDGLKAFQELKKPRTVITLDIVNLYKLLEGKQTWKKLVLGDKFNIVYETFGIKSETQLVELSINLDGNTITTTIANTKDIESAEDKLSKILYDSIGTGKVVDMNKFKFDSINNIKSDVNDLINSKWDAAKNEIVAGVNNSVVMNNRGITITSTDNPNKMIRMTNGVIGLTRDGGNTFRTSITAEGIVGEEIVGKIIIGQHLEMENETGKFSFNQNGVILDGTSLTITGGLPKDQIDPAFVEGIFELNKEYTNGIRMDSTMGLVVTRSDGRAMAYFNATDGMKFMTKTGTVWKDTFYYDVVNNRLVLNGEGNFTELKVNNSSVLTADKLKINGEKIDMIKTDQIVAGNAKISTAMIEKLVVGGNVTMGSNAYISWNQVTGQPFIPKNASDVGAISSTYIDANGIWTGYINADKITTGSISANRINGGTITGVSINVNTDLTVGSLVNLGGSGTRGIRFNGNSAWIYLNGSILTVDSSYISLTGTLTGILDARNVSTFYGVVAAEQSQRIGLYVDNASGDLVVSKNGVRQGSIPIT